LAGAEAAKPDFGEIAESYDRLRPVDEKWWELFDVLVAEGDLLGRRTLDVGCGTGTLTAALAERSGKVWGIDSSPEMLALARAKPTRARFKEGRAESLPFKDRWFERAVIRLGLHLFHRSKALEEVARVLVPGGRVVIATFDPAHFSGYWLNSFFPSLEAIDRARFPDEKTLERELEAAGFAGARTKKLSQGATATKAEVIERIEGRYISTLRLIEQSEFQLGLARAKDALPDEVDYRLEWLIASAERPGLDAVRARG
jgi:ubiquinone/menaquinone biosynthesis C-methylase UbiE